METVKRISKSHFVLVGTLYVVIAMGMEAQKVLPAEYQSYVGIVLQGLLAWRAYLDLSGGRLNAQEGHGDGDTAPE